MVEISFLPAALAREPIKTTFCWKAISSPPKDYHKWAALITAMVKHFKERYGEEEVRNWYFEVWNEPNLNGFWNSDRNEYFKLYTVTANAVKSVRLIIRWEVRPPPDRTGSGSS